MNQRKKTQNQFYNFHLKPIDKNIPLIDYNKLKDYGIWQKKKFLFKGGFGYDKINLKNTSTKLSKEIKMERMFIFKSIINNYNRIVYKKLNDTSPPKDLFNPPLYYNYLKSTKPKKTNLKAKNYSHEKINSSSFCDDYFNENEKMNDLKRENIYNNLNNLYLFYQRKKNIVVNPLNHLFEKKKKVEKKEINPCIKYRLHLLKNNIKKSESMKELNLKS
jgi:hypothetical protein